VFALCRDAASTAVEHIDEAAAVIMFCVISQLMCTQVCHRQCGWLAAELSVKDVWKSTTTVSGEPFVTTTSTASRLEWRATVLASGLQLTFPS